MVEKPILEIQFPNEYFHTVIVETLWHPEGVLDANDSVRVDSRICMRGTGFLYHIEGVNFLVTARHMFTMREWRTNRWMTHPAHPTPTHMRLFLRVEPESGTFNADHLQFVDVVIPLVNADENPTWFEHPLGTAVDLAARHLHDVPLQGIHVLPLEPKDAQYGSEPRFWVTQDTFVVGHPFGLDHGYLWPLWIRGTVASDPSVYFMYKEHEYPFFLIDSRTRPGNSGSPVFLQRRAFGETADEDSLPRSRLIGVYTGRINQESDLGITWHIAEVDRMCRAMQMATNNQ